MPAKERDALIQAYGERFRELGGQFARGEITAFEFQGTMREELRMLNKLQIVAAEGVDKALVGSDDWLKLGSILRSQDAYLEDFTHAVQRGELSEAQIMDRASKYAGSSKETYWRQATRDANLPTYPGIQQCGGRCACEWVDNGDGSYTWTLGAADHCDDCLHNAGAYNPYWPDSALEEAA